MNKETRKFVAGFALIGTAIIMMLFGIRSLDIHPFGWWWLQGLIDLLLGLWWFYQGLVLVKSTIAKDAP